ncbi:hypothetical protein CES85_4420 [Ochrobactrum quorumnocens]|uniref:Uncharacterized protein n=1 Tax=Ochrobactrum quorumnocens TaxID=271865 RepID=A0A248UAA5_9HYPH|nr:hypothetical protein CES85_4420 [[Ochrobactrum] quorumnocens]
MKQAVRAPIWLDQIGALTVCFNTHICPKTVSRFSYAL